MIRRVDFRVQGAAAPQGSKRYLGSGKMIESSRRVGPWREDVRLEASLAMRAEDPWDGPVDVIVEFTFRRPGGHLRRDGSLSAEGRRRPYPYSRGDVDKLLRAVLDAMTAVVFEDDRQVVRATAVKAWGRLDETAITARRGAS